MALYLIGLGLGDEWDITLKGLDAIKKCTKVYLESYTSRLSNENIPALEKLYGKKIIRATRATIEEQEKEVLKEAQTQDVAILIPGSPFSATTHMELVLSARKKNIPIHIIENASILTAVGITGLFLYKFGRVTTIPFDNKNITSPYEAYLENKKQGLHTLFLLDIQGEKLMSAQEGCAYLMKQGLSIATTVIACAALGSPNQEIQIAEVSKIGLSTFPQCLIIPGKLNFKEEEALNMYKR